MNFSSHFLRVFLVFLFWAAFKSFITVAYKFRFKAIWFCFRTMILDPSQDSNIFHSFFHIFLIDFLVTASAFDFMPSNDQFHYWDSNICYLSFHNLSWVFGLKLTAIWVSRFILISHPFAKRVWSFTIRKITLCCLDFFYSKVFSWKA